VVQESISMRPMGQAFRQWLLEEAMAEEPCQSN
jgi:hypothetical protein